MRGGLLFLCIAILLFGLAAHGLFSDGVLAFQRHSRDVILRADQPFWFGFTILAYFAAGVLITGISGFLFWSRRKEKAAEERFFRQRKFLQ
jgi:hypothetical protein